MNTEPNQTQVPPAEIVNEPTPPEEAPKKSSKTLIMSVIALLVVVVGIAIFLIVKPEKSTDSQTATPEKNMPTIKNLGINLDYYDSVTNMAGDFQFTKQQFADDSMKMLFMEFGYEIPGNSASGGVSKLNVQPTLILPLGTQVRALVDGEVYDVPKLYSNDYSVMVKAEGSDLVFETEHVINVKVKKGDQVKAGDVVAEVSDYDARNYAGLGLVEIGILDGSSSGPPHHLCPFDFLDASIKDETFKKINALKAAWEEYRGDTTIYDETKAVIPGCLTQEPIEG